MEKYKLRPGSNWPGSPADRVRSPHHAVPPPERRFSRRRGPDPGQRRTPGDHRHGQVRPRGAQDRRHAGQHRHAGLLCAPGRSRPRRPRYDHRPGHRAGAVQLRRERRNHRAAAGLATQGRAPDLHDRPRRLHHGAGGRHPSGRSCGEGSLSAGPGPNHQHHGADGAGRRLGGDADGRARLRPGRFRAVPPGRRLGRKLLVHVSDIMHSGDELPRVAPGTR